MIEIPKQLSELLDTSLYYEVHSSHKFSLPESHAPTAARLAEFADEIEGIIEYMSRLKPVLRCCEENSFWLVPGGVVRLVDRVTSEASDLADSMEDVEELSDVYALIDSIDGDLADLFDPSEQISNRLTIFNALEEGAREALEKLKEIIASGEPGFVLDK